MKASLVFTLFALLSACASAPKLESAQLTALSEHLPTRVHLEKTPFVEQKAGHCGPASLAMVMAAVPHEVSLETLTTQVYVPGAQGSFQTDMLSAIRRQGLVALPVRNLRDMLQEVEAGRPVLVFQNLAFRWYPRWHYAVVTGYDLDKKKIILHSGPEKNVERDMRIFEQSWKLADAWAYVILKPGEISKTALEEDYLKAGLALEESGQLQPALKAYMNLYQKWPNSLKASLASANILYQMGELQQAKIILKESSIKHPGSFQAWNNLSVVQRELGEKGPAERSLARALRLQKQPEGEMISP